MAMDDPLDELDDDRGLNFLGALRKNFMRSKRARDMDFQQEAPVTDDYDEWSDAPDRLDFKGVDEKTSLFED